MKHFFLFIPFAIAILFACGEFACGETELVQEVAEGIEGSVAVPGKWP